MIFVLRDGSSMARTLAQGSTLVHRVGVAGQAPSGRDRSLPLQELVAPRSWHHEGFELPVRKDDRIDGASVEGAVAAARIGPVFRVVHGQALECQVEDDLLILADVSLI